jgi:hypothetical protein
MEANCAQTGAFAMLKEVLDAKTKQVHLSWPIGEY